MDSQFSAAPLPVERQSPSAAGLRRVVVVAGDHWADLPRSFCRLLIRDALLVEPSPAAYSGRNFRLSSSSSASQWHWQDVFPCSCRTDIDESATVLPSVSCSGTAMNAPLAVAATRWRDVMEHLFVNGDRASTAAHMARLRRITSDGTTRVAADTLAEVWPELFELMRDGGNGLLASPELPQIYAALTTAFARICSLPWNMQVAMEDGSEHTLRPTSRSSGENDEPALTLQDLHSACRLLCRMRAAACDNALTAMWHAEATEDHEATEAACNEAVLLDPHRAEPFLVRAGVRLHAGEPWKCMEDIRVYLWCSARQGLAPQHHATAYCRMAEAFLMELDQRSQKMGALLEDDVFHCLVDEAEASVRLSIRFMPVTMDLFREGSSTGHLLRRIEARRSARRTAAALLDAPMIADTSDGDRTHGSPTPVQNQFALPWPMDLCAGLPDMALFARLPTGSGAQNVSHQDHDPLDLLFLDTRQPLDTFFTLGFLAERAKAFAKKSPEMLHWKHRPKPVNMHIQTTGAERLAHLLLCFLIAKQVGTVVSNEDSKVARKPTGFTQSASARRNAAGAPPPTFTMEETRHDCFLASLLSALLFCRMLTAAQRAEVDRLLSLLIYSSMDLAWMRRVFPWLDLDDNRLSVLTAGAGNQSTESEGNDKQNQRDTGDISRANTSRGSMGESLNGTQEGIGRDARRVSGAALRRMLVGAGGNGTGRGWGSSVLLFQMQQIWLGWLSTAGGEVAAAAKDVGAKPAHKRLDTTAIHEVARQHLLGARAAALCPALDLMGSLPQHLGQRRLWALTGHWPVPAFDPPEVACSGLGNSLDEEDPDSVAERQLEDSSLDDEDPASRLVPTDPRTRWRPMLQELAETSSKDWRVNPCSLNPFTWEFDPGGLEDPFRSFSWAIDKLHSYYAISSGVGGEAGDAAAAVPEQQNSGEDFGEACWSESPSMLQDVSDPPLPHPDSEEPPAVEACWNSIVDLLKTISTTLNALEAAESAKTRAPVLTRDMLKDSAHVVGNADDFMRSSMKSSLRSTVRGLDGSGRPSPRRRRRPEVQSIATGVIKARRGIRDQLAVLKNRTEEDEDKDEDSAEEISMFEVEHELQELKKRRHAEQLETMLRDYVRLDFVRKREADWWGRGGESSAAYKEAIDAGTAATWNPAPVACAPLRLRIRVSAGTPWQVVRAASFRGISYDAIDARNMLCSDVGLLGLCTWFDSVLKSTPHAYIQTRHCEEIFLDSLRGAVNKDGDGNGFLAGTAPADSAIKATQRGPDILAAAGSTWPNPGSGVADFSPAKRPVLGPAGVARWPVARNPLPPGDTPVHPPPSRLLHSQGGRSSSSHNATPVGRCKSTPLQPLAHASLLKGRRSSTPGTPRLGTPRLGTPRLGTPRTGGDRTGGLTPDRLAPRNSFDSLVLDGEVERQISERQATTGVDAVPEEVDGVDVEVPPASVEEAVKESLIIVYHSAVANMALVVDGSEAVLEPIYRRARTVLQAPCTTAESHSATASATGSATASATASRPATAPDPPKKLHAAAEVEPPPSLPQVPAGQAPFYRRKLGQRLFPQSEPRPLRRPKRFGPSRQRQPPLPYSAESSLFEQLVHESVSTKVTGAQMQYLLGVAVRAEPLWGEPCLGQLGACSLPVRGDFFPWDSTLEAAKFSLNWPADPAKFDTNASPPPVAPGVGGGLLEGYEKPHATEIGKPATDPLAVFSRFWPVPDDRAKAKALGPRLLRIRKLGGHPSLSLTPSGKCANAAFCARPALMTDDTAVGGPGPFKCSLCECAWYCSSACQSLHTTAHHFECQALRSLRSAAASLESQKLERTKRTLATLLEHVLSKQFMMAARPEALIGCTALSENLLTAIYGSQQSVPPQPRAFALNDNSDSEQSGDEKQSFYTSSSNPKENAMKDSRGFKVHGKSRLLQWTQMIVVPEDLAQWSVELDAGGLPEAIGRDNLAKRSDHTVGHDNAAGRRGSVRESIRGSVTGLDATSILGSSQARVVPRRFFDVKQSHAHTAAGVVRLLLRWVGATHRCPALGEVIDDGFIFCLITGLCETRHFSKRKLTKNGVVSILAHRMALHVAASQQWRALAPSLAPPRQFQEDGLQGIECAQYTAYYAFLRPLRLPFAQLRPLLPIVCVVWGDVARRALMDLPYKRDEPTPSLERVTSKGSLPWGAQKSPRGMRSTEQGSLMDMAQESLREESLNTLSSTLGGEPSAQRPSKQTLTSFLEVASDHLAQIQLIDSVTLDVLTGKLVLLMYTASVDAARAPDADKNDKATLLLLDAARGMQVVASPLPVRELRRCAL